MKEVENKKEIAEFYKDVRFQNDSNAAFNILERLQERITNIEDFIRSYSNELLKLKEFLNADPFRRNMRGDNVSSPSEACDIVKGVRR